MKKQKIPLSFVLGACLVVLSGFLMIAYQIRMQTGAEQSRRIAGKLEEILPERTVGVVGLYPNSAMPVLEIEGVDYVAVLEIPSLGLMLPVADRWDSNKLSDGPARFFGSAYDGALILGGIDEPWQFGFCDKIEHGAIITITDMTGAQFTYTVAGVDRAGHAQAQWLMRGDSDLTLFCHDIYSMEYIAVRCNLVYK